MARKRETQYLLNAIEKGVRRVQKAINEMPDKLAEDIDEEAKSIISRWYAEREPIYYKRTMGLKKAYKIEIDGINVEVKYRSEFMEEAGHNYHQSTELVYNNTFVRGYHGGSAGTDRNGETVTGPYWRTPFLYYCNWGYRAPKYSSPYIKIRRDTQKKMRDYEKQWSDLLSEVIGSIRRSYGGYVRK